MIAFVATVTFRLASRRHMRFFSMTSVAAASTNPEGNNWIYKSQQDAPFPSSMQLLKDASSNIKCPLPKMTPSIPPEKRLHRSNSSLEELYNSKADFYREQFEQRVVKADTTRIQRRRVQSPHSKRETDVTIYRPDNSESKMKGMCLHVHGGGWLWGDSHDQVAHRCLEMASRLTAAVVSVEYSLLHHDRFNPVGDVIAALEWIESCGAKELGSEPVYVASGESSGAHLLMLAMLHRRDDTMPKSSLKDAWKCLNLVYGVFDLSGTPSIRSDGEKSAPLCGDELLWLYKLYCSKVQSDDSLPVDSNDASVSPLYADLSSLPPALLSVGTADPLLDDTLLMAEKYKSCNNDVEVSLIEAGEHGK